MQHRNDADWMEQPCQHQELSMEWIAYLDGRTSNLTEENRDTSTPRTKLTPQLDIKVRSKHGLHGGIKDSRAPYRWNWNSSNFSDVFSSMRRKSDNARLPIEPLAFLLRHPYFPCSREYVMSMDYLVLSSADMLPVDRASPRRQHFFFDAGCSSYSDTPGMHWFVEELWEF